MEYVFFYTLHINVCSNMITAYSNKTPRNGINCGPEGHVENSSQYITITQNIVSNNWDYHITTEGCNNVTISNNVTNGQCITSIIERGSYITCSSNNINVIPRVNTVSNGIEYYQVNYGIVSSNVINANTLNQNSSYGIFLKEGNHNLVIGNIITGTFNTSVNLITESDDLINSNIITASSIGISIYSCNDITCQTNKIDTISQYGIYAASSSNVECIYNRISNAAYGLFLGTGCNTILFLNNILKSTVKILSWFSPTAISVTYTNAD